MQISRAKFLSMTIDIILELLNFLDPSDTLHLAAVCRDLAALVSYIYYTRSGLSKPLEKVYIKSDYPGYMDYLTALSLDLQLSSIQHFVFHSIHNPPRTNPMARDIDRLCNLFGRFQSVGSLCIKLQSTTNVGWSMQSSSVQRFTVTFQRLLEIIIHKRCTSLHIQLSHPVTTNYEFQLVDRKLPRRLIRSAVDSTVRQPEFHGEGWQFSKMYDIPILLAHPPAIPSTRLTHIDLSSDFLLIPPYSLGTFAILKSSPVISLTLSMPNHTMMDAFQHYIFPNIVESIPSLRQLKFTFRGSSFLGTVTSNLPRLPHLQKLILGNTYYGPFNEARPGTGLNGICNLRSLTGSLDQVVYLLKNLHFPALEFINLLIEFRFRLETHFVETGSQFMTIHRLLSRMNVEPRISVRLLHQGELLTGISFQAFTLRMVDPRNIERTWIANFRYVTHLYLEVAMSDQEIELSLSSKESQVEYVSDYALSWLSIFRGVTNLKLICRQPLLWTASTSSKSLVRDRWTTTISNKIQGRQSTIQALDVLYIAKSSLRHWTCDDQDWGMGDISMSERDVECHFNPDTHTRSLKPDWVMHDGGFAE